MSHADRQRHLGGGEGGGQGGDAGEEVQVGGLGGEGGGGEGGGAVHLYQLTGHHLRLARCCSARSACSACSSRGAQCECQLVPSLQTENKCTENWCAGLQGLQSNHNIY